MTFPALDVLWRDAPGDQHIDLLLAELDACGPTAVEPLPRGVRLHFASAAARDQAAACVRSLGPGLAGTSVNLPDEHWAERSQAALRAVTVGALTIAPPWDVPEAVVPPIVIAPSMGFGTGHHATTRLCLALLQTVSVAGARVLDVGTGSGVLALAAWRLGATSVVAIDNDAHALEAAADNVAANGARDAVELRHLDLQTAFADELPADVDLLLANLTGAALATLASRLMRCLAPGGTAIVSGLLAEEEPAVVAAFAASGATTSARHVEDEWAALALTR